MTTNKETINLDHEEYQYLNLVKHVLKHGIEDDDRTGVGTYSILGNLMRFDLTDGKLPLLTTKKVNFKSVLGELLWFISGKTDSTNLKDQGINIWNANGSREFLDACGFGDREEGDLGPVYGFQWRHWGAKYETSKTDYTGKGIDQLAKCIQMIKETPNSRRIIMNAWNVSDIELMVLPPCHVMCQFRVYKKQGLLSCIMTQRSCDIGLGVPFNIASYATLTHIIAHVCGLKPYEFVYQMNDVHIYKSHVEKLKSQLDRTPKMFPTLKINTDNKDIDSFVMDDFILENYEHDDYIKMDMAL